MECQSEEEHRIRRNAKLMVAVMLVVVAVFVVGVAITNPQFLAVALVVGPILVVLPVIYYLYTKRVFYFLGDLFDR